MFDAQSVHPYGSFWLDVLDKGIKASAVIIGGFWAWFNVNRSRTYRRKLEPSISAETFQSEGTTYAQINCRLKNVGSSVYEISQTGTGLIVQALTSQGRQHLDTIAVFVDHAWIEPGEQVEDPLVISVPAYDSYVALLLNLRIVSHSLEWNASYVLRAHPVTSDVTKSQTPEVDGYEAT